jgi:hypothetical protein
VFGDQQLADIIDTVHALDLDIAQLHGACTPTSIEAIRRETGCAVWPVLRVAGTTLPADAAALAAAAGAVVLDAHVVGQLGGTGVALDWSGLHDAVQALRRRAQSDDLRQGHGKYESRDVREAYLARVAGDVKLGRLMRVAIDCGNGSPGAIDRVTSSTAVKPP